MRHWLVLGVVMLAASAAAGPRPGSVVRVERRGGPTGHPRLCMLQPELGGNAAGYCIGGKLDSGDRIDVVDAIHPLAVLRITTSVPYQDRCNPEPVVWQVEAAVETGDLGAAQGQAWGVGGVSLSPRGAHIVTVDHGPTGTPATVPNQIQAFDRDGDGVADLEFVEFQCDDQGIRVSSGDLNCFEIWMARGATFERIDRMRSRNCY